MDSDVHDIFIQYILISVKESSSFELLFIYKYLILG